MLIQYSIFSLKKHVITIENWLYMLKLEQIFGKRRLFMSIRFYHTADLHLDSPFKGLYNLPQVIVEELRRSTFKAFERLVDEAISERPDFILIVGDVYDGENRSLTAQNRFVQQLKRLNNVNIPVVVSYGNHDHLSGNWSRFDLPENVHEFGPEVSEVTLTIRDEKVTIHGFSYGKRHIKESMIEQYRRKMDDTIHIGMLHGSIEGDEEHNVYAPFSRQALLQKNYQYWALGHIHKRQILYDEPAIVYPGNTQGRHRKESGEKGFYEVILDRGNTQLNFKETSTIRFETLELNVPTIEKANDLLNFINQKIREFSDVYGAVIIDLKLKNLNEEASKLYFKNGKNMWLEAVRDLLNSSEQIIWLNDIQAMVWNTNYEESELTKKIMLQIDQVTEKTINARLADLFDHPKIARHIEEYKESEWLEMQKEAQQLIVEQLQKGGKD